MGTSEPTIRPTVPDDLHAIGEIYAHHVLTGVATFETIPPDRQEWTRRLRGVADAGLPFVTAQVDGMVDENAEASLAMHRNRGFVDAGRLASVGFKHGRWLDTVLLQRSLN